MGRYLSLCDPSFCSPTLHKLHTAFDVKPDHTLPRPPDRLCIGLHSPVSCSEQVHLVVASERAGSSSGSNLRLRYFDPLRNDLRRSVQAFDSRRLHLSFLSLSVSFSLFFASMCDFWDQKRVGVVCEVVQWFAGFGGKDVWWRSIRPLPLNLNLTLKLPAVSDVSLWSYLATVSPTQICFGLCETSCFLFIFPNMSTIPLYKMKM